MKNKMFRFAIGSMTKNLRVPFLKNKTSFQMTSIDKFSSKENLRRIQKLIGAKSIFFRSSFFVSNVLPNIYLVVFFIPGDD